jgi:hypothetical protein
MFPNSGRQGTPINLTDDAHPVNVTVELSSHVLAWRISPMAADRARAP